MKQLDSFVIVNQIKQANGHAATWLEPKIVPACVRIAQSIIQALPGQYDLPLDYGVKRLSDQPAELFKRKLPNIKGFAVRAGMSLEEAYRFCGELPQLTSELLAAAKIRQHRAKGALEVLKSCHKKLV